jgi:filamentous hemagglutinin
VELYTKTLRLNGQLHAKELDLITGENTITRDGTITSDTVAGSGYSIDSSALGGIYGSTIRLVGTDKGVGINLPRITYASDSLSLSADGHIVIGAAVASKSLTSQSESLTVNEMLYGGDTIDLSASDTIHNTPNALILSHGEITIHDTGTLLNDAARIEASGDIVIQADRVENLSNAIPIKTSVTSSVSELIPLSPVTADSKNSVTEIQTIDKNGYTPAYLLSGGDMVIDAAIHNRYSLIASDQDMYLFGSLDNEASVEARTRIDITHNYFYMTMDDGAWHYGFTTYENTDTLTDHVYSTIQAGGDLYGNLISVNNADVTDGTSFSSSGIAPTSYTQNTTTGAITYTLPSGGNGEFVLSTDPSHNYLIESNPLFTDYGTFISSDYILSRLNLDTAANTKRLGDARYETQLVRDAVFRLTGERYLSGFGSDTSQYQALMDNALAVAGDLKLSLGVTLSASQIAALSRDIVWMEEQEVAGQQVLVPVLYLASLKNQELTQGGKIIAKGDIQLDIAQGLNNAGEIRALGTLLVQADSITNSGGAIKSDGDMLLHTVGDITNTSGKISGDNVALVSDEGTIVSQTDLKSLDLSDRVGTSGSLSLVGERASIQSRGDMLISASGDITLTGAETSAGGNVALSSTEGEVNLLSLGQTSRYTSMGGDSFSEIGTTKQYATALEAAGDIRIEADRGITLLSSRIKGKEVSLEAKTDITLAAAADESMIDLNTQGKKGGIIDSTSTYEHLNLSRSTSIASTIEGESVRLQSGKDITLQGSNIIAINDALLTAAHDINILSSRDTVNQTYDKQVKKTGFSFDDSAGVSSVIHSKTATTTHDATQRTQAVASNIVSLGGNTTLNATEHLQIEGSNLEASNDLTLIAKSIDITAAENTFNQQYNEQIDSKGVSMGYTRAPLLAMKSAYNGAKGETPENGSFMNTLSREFEGSNAAAGAAATTSVLSIRNTHDTLSQTASSSNAAVSTLTAGGNLNIIATEGSIASVGTQMSAEGDALLLAKESITLIAARNAIKEDSATTSRGLVFDNRSSANTPTDMLGVYTKRGNGSGGESSLTPTQLSIGGTTTLKTDEGDIALMGANIASSGDVTIDSARNLLIQSAGESGNGANTFNNQAIGKVYISDTERFSGYHTEKHKDNGADTLQISSNVASLGGSVNLTAANAFSQNGSNVMALEDINVNAKSIEIDNSYNTGYFYSDDKTLKIGAFARVGSPILDLVQTVEAAEASDGRLQTMQSMAAAANVYKVASAIPGSGGSGALVFAEAGVGIKGSNASETATYTTAQTGSITAGENLTLTTTEGDIRIKGSSLAAGDTLTLDSANDIYLEAAKSTEHSDAKHSNYGIEVGVGASYGAQTGVYVYVGIQAGKGKSYFDGTTYENALLLADTLNLSANRDITLKGGEAHAETINVNAGENLTIESLQESEYGKESESGMNLKVQVSFGTAWEIKDKGGNGGINSAKANGEYLGVNQQSGLFAGDGGYHVNVGENTNLVGGAIASSNPSNSTLTTDTLTLANLENKMSYSAATISMSGGVNSNATGTTPSFNPGIPMHEEGGDTTITYATITDGTITVGGVTTNSAESLGAHTDLATAHTALEKLPDLKQLLADQQAMAAAASTIISVSNQIASDIAGNAEKTKDNLKNEFGNTLSPEDQQIYNSLTPTQKESVLLNNADATTIAAYNEAQTTISHWGVGGDYSRALGVVTSIIVGSTTGATSTQITANAVAPYAAELIGNTFDHTDDPNKVAQLLSHAVLGGVLAYANGGNAASGALAGAGAEAASLAIAKELYPDAFDADGTFHRDRLSEGQANAILALSGAVGAFVGGVSGGGINNAVIDANVAQNAVENNKLSEAQKIERAKDIVSCNGDAGCKFLKEQKWVFISNNQQMQSLGSGAVDIYNGLGNSLTGMWENSPWYAKAPLVTAGGIFALPAIVPTTEYGYWYMARNPEQVIGGVEIANDVFNPSMPPSTNIGYWYFLYDNLKNNTNTIYEAITK